MKYDRICDVPRGTEILIPHKVYGCHRKTGARKMFQFEMRYGAHPRHWAGWQTVATDYCYFGMLSSPDGFRTTNGERP